MHRVLEYRQQAKDILTGHSKKKVLIIGPCSIHNVETTLEYAARLKQLSLEVEDKLFIVMRAFIEKPRTSNEWRGFINDPLIDGSCDLKAGIKLSQELFEELQELKLPLATEFIDPNLTPLFESYITWGFIGARTMRSPIHRQLASHLNMPVGFKNPLDGDLKALEAAILVASRSQYGLLADEHLRLNFTQTKGNSFCHGVLRGSHLAPNYTQARHMQRPIMIDCAHGNSGKTVLGMEKVFRESMPMVQEHPHIIGFMLESFLSEGRQSLPLQKGLSITDPCLGWDQTCDLVMAFYKLLSQSQGSSSVLTGSSLRDLSSSEILINGV